MGNFIIILNRIINLYLYFVIIGCILSWVPYINPNYPMFHAIFKFSGYYLIPPLFGVLLGPAILMITLALISMGLEKIHKKFFAEKEPQVFILTKDEFIKAINMNNKLKEIKKEKDNNNDSNQDTTID